MNHTIIEGFISQDLDKECENHYFKTFDTLEFDYVLHFKEQVVRSPATPEYEEYQGKLYPVRCKLNKGISANKKWDGMGLTYYQARIYDESHGSIPSNPTAVISFTLYHNDVVKFANTGDHWLNQVNDGNYIDDLKYGTVKMMSVKRPDSPFYEVGLTIKDPGDWLVDAKLKAYIYIPG